VTCLWSESFRYCGRKNGYHGGVSLQEVTVPLSVLVPFGMNLPQWQSALPVQPEWWDLPNLATPAIAVQPRAPVARAPTRKQLAAAAAQNQLFDATLAPIPETPPLQVQDWITTLLQSPLYASQRALAARVALPDEQIRALLNALTERGGKLSKAALAQRVSAPEMRLAGMLSAARRVLNVDQAAELQVDEAAGAGELNRVLLMQQFRITQVGGVR
jgi:hypothetical protein